MNNIILIGFMGSGKTSIGKQLSDMNHYQFLDTDCLIEQSQNKKIADIFQTDGEEAFREMETQCLMGLLHETQNVPRILSVGGGLALRKINQELLKQFGYIIFLRAKPETIYCRLMNDKTRPLLQGDNPEIKINKLMGERNTIYESISDLVIDVDNKTIEDISREIMKEDI